ncbi:hypothetical protein N7474_009849 [Penicillium riverlandense]|uniref:uncharacterized protein n=1 Tax=Penicillium riverlandense TaxID=1903569 RepID=UPI0025480A4D|nr:uncharacterized protein N7474_009849 [Penicillium riverlandense]KAJ5808580.1 hypothetical protein N7474_009849 [Penicillium riverlandense]
MFFSGAKVLTLGLSILSCIAASPIYPRLPSGQLIGYRTTRPRPTTSSTPLACLLFLIVLTSNRYCAISADPNAWNAIAKAWIPEIGPDGNRLWGDDTHLFAQKKYLESLGLDPAKTIRMSLIDTRRDKFEPLDKLDKLQMVIPNELTNANGGGLKIRVECHPTIEEFDGNTPEIDYYSWKNVHGKPQYAACS